MANETRISDHAIHEMANRYQTAADTVNNLMTEVESTFGFLYLCDANILTQISEQYGDVYYQSFKSELMKFEKLLRAIATELDILVTPFVPEPGPAELAELFK